MLDRWRMGPLRGRTGARWALPLAGALLAAGCGREPDAEAAAPAVVAVGPENVAVAALDRIQTGPLLSGTLAAARAATIRAEVGGTVLQVYASEGERVRAGQPLARIEDADVRDAYASARTAVSTATGALEVARRDLERARTLAEAGAVPARNVEVARTQLSSAEAQLAEAQARLASARRRLDATRVAAPLSGVVGRRAVSAGDVVAPGAELFTVIDPGSMELRASVASHELGALRVGMPVEFQVRGYPGQSFTGRVERIGAQADPSTRQVPIYVSIPNTAGTLVSGLFAEGRVASELREGVVVPSTAVSAGGGTPTVLRVKGGRTEQVPVALGIADPRTERVEITSGVAVGDTLLVGAAQGITPGTPVRVGSAAGAPGQ